MNTYPDDAPMQEKLYEEIRCTRCALERILRVMDEGLFVDYQMEKFGSGFKQDRCIENEADIYTGEDLKVRFK